MRYNEGNNRCPKQQNLRTGPQNGVYHGSYLCEELWVGSKPEIMGFEG